MTDEVVDSRLANALLDVAIGNVPGPARRASERVRSRDHGLWVGGRASVTATDYQFHANAMNRRVQRGSMDVVIPLADIDEISTTQGFVSSLVTARARRAELTIRCYGAKRFADILRAQVTQARGGMPPA